MIRAVVLLRDLVIALALGWIGVSIDPVKEPVTETACAVKGADAPPQMCARAPGFSVAGFGMELAAEGPGCPTG